MNTIEDLKAAFARIIIDYRNKKTTNPIHRFDIEQFVNSADACQQLANCKEDLLAVSASNKDEHIALFYRIYENLDAEFPSSLTLEQLSELNSFKDNLVSTIQQIYGLNHSGKGVTIYYSANKYDLTTTVGYGGWYGLTELGESIRQYLLMPLGASGVKPEQANCNIKEKIHDLFQNKAHEISQRHIQRKSELTMQKLQQGQERLQSLDKSAASTMQALVEGTLVATSAQIMAEQGMFNKPESITGLLLEDKPAAKYADASAKASTQHLGGLIAW